MIRLTRLIVILLLAAWLAACAPSTSMIVTVPPENRAAGAQATPMLAEADLPVPPKATTTPTEVTLPAAAPTDTPLPPLDLPTPEPSPPPVEAWDGQPTYLAESAPNTFFRVNYNPHLWAKTEDQSGQIVLAHRAIPYCVITPATGRGLPAGLNSQREIRMVGAVEYEINLTFEGDTPLYVAYYGGTPGELYTGFQVSFQEQAETCLQDAEAVLASLRAVPQVEATPGL